MPKRRPPSPRRRKPLTVTEFAVEVAEDRVDWGGVDQFLAWLLHQRPEGGFLPYAQAINRLNRGSCRRR